MSYGPAHLRALAEFAIVVAILAATMAIVLMFL